MAVGNVILFDSFKEWMGDNTIDMDADAFKVQLHTSTFVPNIGTMTVRADLTNELTTQFGYTVGGAALGTPTWVKSGSTVTFDGDDVVWNAAGGDIVARYAVIYDDTTAAPLDALVGYVLLDTTPGDVTAVDGNPLTIQWNASGILTLSGAIS